MASCSYAFSITATTQKPELPPPAFHQLSSSLSPALKQPLFKEWKALPTRIQVPNFIKTASVSLMDAFVNSSITFSGDPMLIQGNFAPVNEIGKEVVLSSIEGEVPADLPEGVYVRNGPNAIFPNASSAASIFGKTELVWFEGDGMIHATYFNKENKGGWRVAYKNRYVESESFKMEKGQKKLFLPAIAGSSPTAVLASIIINMLRFGKPNKDINNTNVFEHAGKVYAISENHLPHEIDVSSLDTLRIWNVNGAWDRPFTSHPKKVPGSGEMVIMGVDVKKPYFVLGIISADGKKLVHKVDLKFKRCTLIHEIAVTENYNVIMDYPLMMGIDRLMAGKMFIEYERGQQSRIGVMPRYGDAESVRWFDVRAHCTLHIINSFEDGEEVVIRGCKTTGAILQPPWKKINKYKWGRRAYQYVSSDSKSFDPSADGVIYPIPYEWRLNLKTGAVKETYLRGTEVAMDFPTINDCYVGRKNKYAYTQVLDSVTSCKIGMTICNKFAKLCFDEQDKEKEGLIKVEYHELGEKKFCSGLHFVRKPGGIEEDDGWAICYVHDEEKDTSQVYIIDAKKFSERPVAKITLPQRVPYGFHANFISK